MKLQFKKINSITKIKKKTLVYNISVEKNKNYFANGILTHNCYVHRNKPKGISIATNYDEINRVVEDHISTLNWEKVPNQTHSKYYTYDIGCNTDVALHWKFMKNMGIFELFINNPKAFGTFATKYVNEDLLKINPKRKIRIRFSLMPEEFSMVLEPDTTPIKDRIIAINKFYEAGYDVHVNYSPIIINKNTRDYYIKLFKQIDKLVDDSIKNTVKAECIFLTHNEKLHQYNLDNNIQGEDFLWTPELQESKTSSYGSKNIRYKWQDKNKYKQRFLNLLKEHLPWQEVRYIF